MPGWAVWRKNSLEKNHFVSQHLSAIYTSFEHFFSRRWQKKCGPGRQTCLLRVQRNNLRIFSWQFPLSSIFSELQTCEENFGRNKKLETLSKLHSKGPDDSLEEEFFWIKFFIIQLTVQTIQGEIFSTVILLKPNM